MRDRIGRERDGRANDREEGRSSTVTFLILVMDKCCLLRTIIGCLCGENITV